MGKRFDMKATGVQAVCSTKMAGYSTINKTPFAKTNFSSDMNPPLYALFSHV